MATSSVGSWDTIIVGAGTAGCIVAERLSRDPSRRVLLLEAGSADGPTPPDLFAALDVPGRLWPGLTARRTPAGVPRSYLRGRGVGGSGSVNGLIALDPPLSDLTLWRKLGLNLEVLRPPSISPHYVPLADWGPADRLLALTARASGLPLVRRAHVDTPGVGPAPLHLNALGRRASTDITHLAAARQRPNLDVRTSVPVETIAIERGRVVGVMGRTTEGTTTSFDAATVVVCAGALHSPTLLLRSGLVRAGIGRNLRDHPAVGVSLALRQPADESVPATCVVAHTVDRIQLLALNRLGTTPELRRHGALMAAVLTPMSTGTVTLQDDGSPEVTFDLLGDAHDRNAIVRATRLLLQLTSSVEAMTYATAAFIDDHGTPVAALADATDAELLGWAEENLADYVHATGTCRFGAVDDPDAVVGPAGAVHGVSGLHVIDASVFPTSPGANPWQATVLLADALAQELVTGRDATPAT